MMRCQLLDFGALAISSNLNDRMPTQSPSSRLRSFITLLFAAPLLLALTQCGKGSPSAVGTEHCGGISCTGITQCQTNAPLCAIATSATCLTDAPRECAWKLNISSSCPCLEHDVRLCTVSGNPGVQICTANPARTATAWAACQTTPACTP